ncbi:MAG: transposase, partial [Chitinophagaceae bacterium]|nr:transposase [Chitinophagaceae bacterium]
WDRLVRYYDDLFPSKEGRPPISGRVILGAVIIKHLGDLSDRETIAQIQENMFMQYFLGYSSFTNEEPFSDTLFVEIRKRLSLELLGKINETIALYCMDIVAARTEEQKKSEDKNQPTSSKDDIEPDKTNESLNQEATVASEKELPIKFYCSRENRKQLKLLDIKLIAKPLGRPSALAVQNHIRPGERNPIEGKFGQGKTAYGLNKIRARLSDTSTSWIAAIALVLNLVKLAGQALIRLTDLKRNQIVNSGRYFVIPFLQYDGEAELLSKP